MQGSTRGFNRFARRNCCHGDRCPCLNPHSDKRSLEVMDLTDSGLFERIRILPYPELPPDRPKDGDLAMNVISEPAIRQAMLALLVRYAVANRCGHRTIFQAWPRLARWPGMMPCVTQGTG